MLGRGGIDKQNLEGAWANNDERIYHMRRRGRSVVGCKNDRQMWDHASGVTNLMRAGNVRYLVSINQLVPVGIAYSINTSILYECIVHLKWGEQPR